MSVMSAIGSQFGTDVKPQKLAAINATNDAAGSDSSGDSATISANDFLTLLVTEMKNQDPTANTDPNQYINQLVNVNSLQQLISINQTLTTATISPVKKGSTQAAPSPQTEPSVHAVTQKATGNLTVPRSNPAAVRVAQALQAR